MNPKDAQTVKAIAEKVFAKSLRRMADDVGPLVNANALLTEADRLAPAEPDPFAGVKYVVWCSEVYALVGRHDAAVMMIAAPPGKPFMGTPEGKPFVALEAHITPWNPKVGDKVRFEPEPSGGGEVLAVTERGYHVQWADGNCAWFPVGCLQPISFAPPEPEPEKAEFENGTLVADADDDLFAAIVKGSENAYLSISGDEADVELPCRVATNDDITQFAAASPLTTRAALRIHAKHIAGEAT